LEIQEYYTWQKCDCVIVFPVTEDNHVILIKQYRHGIKKVCIDYPGGTIEDGQDVFEAARSELVEETGYGSVIYKALGTYLMDSSYSNQKTHFVIALGCKKSVSISNPREITEVLRVPLEEIAKFAENSIECLLCRHLTTDAVTMLKKKEENNE